MLHRRKDLSGPTQLCPPSALDAADVSLTNTSSNLTQKGPFVVPALTAWLTLTATTRSVCRWISMGSNRIRKKGVTATQARLRPSAGPEITGFSSDVTRHSSLMCAFNMGSPPSWPRAQGLCKHQLTRQSEPILQTRNKDVHVPLTTSTHMEPPSYTWCEVEA